MDSDGHLGGADFAAGLLCDRAFVETSVIRCGMGDTEDIQNFIRVGLLLLNSTYSLGLDQSETEIQTIHSCTV